MGELSQFRSTFCSLERQLLFDTAVLKTIQTGYAVLFSSLGNDLFFGRFHLYLSSFILSLGSEADQEEEEESYERFHVLRFI